MGLFDSIFGGRQPGVSNPTAPRPIGMARTNEEMAGQVASLPRTNPWNATPNHDWASMGNSSGDRINDIIMNRARNFFPEETGAMTVEHGPGGTRLAGIGPRYGYARQNVADARLERMQVSDSQLGGHSIPRETGTKGVPLEPKGFTPSSASTASYGGNSIPGEPGTGWEFATERPTYNGPMGGHTIPGPSGPEGARMVEPGDIWSTRRPAPQVAKSVTTEPGGYFPGVQGPPSELAPAAEMEGPGGLLGALRGMGKWEGVTGGAGRLGGTAIGLAKGAGIGAMIEGVANPEAALGLVGGAGAAPDMTKASDGHDFRRGMGALVSGNYSWPQLGHAVAEGTGLNSLARAGENLGSAAASWYTHGAQDFNAGRQRIADTLFGAGDPMIKLRQQQAALNHPQSITTNPSIGMRTPTGQVGVTSTPQAATAQAAGQPSGPGNPGIPPSRSVPPSLAPAVTPRAAPAVAQTPAQTPAPPQPGITPQAAPVVPPHWAAYQEADKRYADLSDKYGVQLNGNYGQWSDGSVSREPTPQQMAEVNAAKAEAHQMRQIDSDAGWRYTDAGGWSPPGGSRPPVVIHRSNPWGTDEMPQFVGGNNDLTSALQRAGQYARTPEQLGTIAHIADQHTHTEAQAENLRAEASKYREQAQNPMGLAPGVNPNAVVEAKMQMPPGSSVHQPWEDIPALNTWGHQQTPTLSGFRGAVQTAHSDLNNPEVLKMIEGLLETKFPDLPGLYKENAGGIFGQSEDSRQNQELLRRLRPDLFPQP